MKYIIKLIIAVATLTLAFSHVSAQTPREILDAKADSAYAREQYAEAAELYKQSIDSFGVSSRIYYNLGNAYYRIGDLGHSIISYERALRINPTDQDARQNLDFVMTKIEDRPEDDSSFLTNLHQSLRSQMTPNGWAWISFAIFIIFLGTIAVYVFASDVVWRKVGFFGGLVVLFILIYTLYLTFDSREMAKSNDYAVVVVPSTNVNSEPRTARDKNDKIVPLHEGTEVLIVDSILTPDDPETGKWYEVKINNSTRAWIASDAVEKI